MASAFCAVHAAPLNEEIDGLLIGCDNAGESADFSGHVCHCGSFVNTQILNGLTRILHHLGQRLAVTNVSQAKNLAK